MNKTFKVVFNKARGMLMVVNESTSSVQKKPGTTWLTAAVMATFMAAPAFAEDVVRTVIEEDTALVSSSDNPESSYLLGMSLIQEYNKTRDKRTLLEARNNLEDSLTYLKSTNQERYRKAFVDIISIYSKFKEFDGIKHFLTSRSNNGDDEAGCFIFEIFSDHLIDGVTFDTQEAFSHLEKSANLGNCFAQYNLAQIYIGAVSIPNSRKIDYNSGFKYLQKCVENPKSDADILQQARHNLAVLYLKGLGVERDKEKARQLFQQNCLAGSELDCRTVSKFR